MNLIMCLFRYMSESPHLLLENPPNHWLALHITIWILQVAIIHFSKLSTAEPSSEYFREHSSNSQSDSWSKVSSDSWSEASSDSWSEAYSDSSLETSWDSSLDPSSESSSPEESSCLRESCLMVHPAYLPDQSWYLLQLTVCFLL